MNSVSTVQPFVEALTMPNIRGGRPWDGLLRTSTTNEVVARRKLRQELDQAVYVDPIEERYGLYRALNELLATGTNDRFVLYCPLYLVPHVDWYRKYDESVDCFSELFLASWHRMLQVHDVRANFIDGDVPDIELGEESLRMVVQAARLAPHLVEKGLVHRERIPDDDPILRESLADSFQPLRIESEYIFNRTRPLCESVADGLAFQTPTDVSEKRAKWLEWDHRRRCKMAMGVTLSRWFIDGSGSQLISTELDDDSMEVMALGIGTAIESIWRRGLGFHAKVPMDLAEKYEPYLERLYQNEAIRDTVTSVICRLHSMGFIRKRKLDQLGIFYPTLEGPLLRNLSPIQPELAKIREVLRDPEVAAIIYPAVVVYGSKLKGYGGLGSDLDTAVFVRPETDYRDLGGFLENKFGRDAAVYWLVEDGSDLRVHDFDGLAANIGGSMDAHVFLGGAWEGDPDTIHMLGERLLKPYFRETNELVRDVWLREMERDLLQYRLLHRGYERFNTLRADDIFLDDGYRMTASQLFASHVFVPRI